MTIKLPNFPKSLKESFARLAKPLTSFKEKFLLSWVYDSVFYSVIVLLFLQAFAMLANQLLTLQPLVNQAAVSAELAAQAAAGMTKLVWTTGASVILVPLFALALYSLFKGAIWRMIAENKAAKFGWKPFWKFFLLNLIWYVVSVPVFAGWLALIFYLAALFGVAWLAWIVLVLSILLWLHLLITMHYSFAHNQKISKSLASIFKVGFARIGGFVLPYALAVIVFWIWSQLWAALARLNISPKLQLIAASVVIIAPFAAWLRIYIAEGLKEITGRVKFK